jgi:hypothetical protein
MPTSKELVSNKPLQGLELAEIIRADVNRMLEGSGFLAGQVAYSRIAYEVRLTLHLDLPSMPSAIDSTRSRTQAADLVRERPGLAALEPSMPLAAPSADALLSSIEIQREITSPNLARVEHSLPIEVEVMGQDGHVREQLVTYHASDVGMRDDDFPQPDLTDVTPAQRRELGL